MPISLSPARPARPEAAPSDPGALKGGSKERNVPRAVLGSLLVAACALAGAYAYFASGGSAQVLRMAQRVPAGAVIQASDLTSAKVTGGANSGLVSSSQESLVVGRTAAVTLVAGGYLTAGDLGAASLPAGQAEVEIDAKFGSYPSDLSVGARVAVSSVAASGSATASSAGVAPLSGDPQATVVAVTPSSSGDGSAGIELSADAADAASINAIPVGQAVVAVISAGGE